MMIQPALGQLAVLACLWEASVPKPGNVHRGADFEDLTFYDFQASAVAVMPPFDEARENGVGATILKAVRATQAAVATNTNLGLMLLMAPLAVATECSAVAIQRVLENLQEQDSRDVFQAIQLAQPGGLGISAEMDVAGEAPQELLQAMRYASERDLIAAQYVNGFKDLFADAVEPLHDKLVQGIDLPRAIVQTHVQFMSLHPDSLIRRKCGIKIAEQAAALAAKTDSLLTQSEQMYERELAELDFWLRSDGHQRNPGTTADFIGAAIFVGLIQGWIQPDMNRLNTESKV